MGKVYEEHEASFPAFSIFQEIFFFLSFLGPHSQYREVPRLRAELELQLPAYSTAIAAWDQSLVCDLQSEARDRTPILTDTSRVFNMLSHNGNSSSDF